MRLDGDVQDVIERKRILERDFQKEIGNKDKHIYNAVFIIVKKYIHPEKRVCIFRKRDTLRH